MRPDVCEAEIIPLEKQRFAGDFRQGIGEAIAEIQSSRVAAALAEVAIGGAGDDFMLFVQRSLLPSRPVIANGSKARRISAKIAMASRKGIEPLTPGLGNL